MSDLPNYKVYAIRYATRASKRSENFIGGDPHDGPMPMDYFVWVAVGRGGAYVISDGNFESPAVEAAPAAGIVLIDGESLIDLVIETTLKDESKPTVGSKIAGVFGRKK